MPIPFVLIAITFFALLPQEPKQINSFSLDRKSQQCGEAGLLKWHIPEASKVYITGLGSVATQGEKLVNPTETRKYLLLADTPSGGVQQEVEFLISSSCGKGPEEYPNINRFQNSLRFEKDVSSLPQFLERVHGALQNSLGFAVNEFSNEASQFVFLTTLIQRGNLVRPGETKIGARRLSYLVIVKKVKDKPLTMNYTIATLIEFRRRIESTWYQEHDSDLHREQAERLRQLIHSID